MFVAVCSHPIPAVRFVGIFVGIVLVSGEQTFTANFAIPNEGIEQMARKNDGANKLWRMGYRFHKFVF